MSTINKACFFVSVVSDFSWLFHVFHFAISLIINVLPRVMGKSLCVETKWNNWNFADEKTIYNFASGNEQKLKYSLKILDNEQIAKNQDCQRNHRFRNLYSCLLHNRGNHRHCHGLGLMGSFKQNHKSSPGHHQHCMCRKRLGVYRYRSLPQQTVQKEYWRTIRQAFWRSGNLSPLYCQDSSFYSCYKAGISCVKTHVHIKLV